MASYIGQNDVFGPVGVKPALAITGIIKCLYSHAVFHSLHPSNVCANFSKPLKNLSKSMCWEELQMDQS